MEVERDESHKRNRRNYAKANFIDLKKFFDIIDWKVMKGLKDVQQKYDFFPGEI